MAKVHKLQSLSSKNGPDEHLAMNHPQRTSELQITLHENNSAKSSGAHLLWMPKRMFIVSILFALEIPKFLSVLITFSIDRDDLVRFPEPSAAFLLTPASSRLRQSFD